MTDCPDCRALQTELCPECAAVLAEHIDEMNEEYWT
jgi:ribosomal protein S27AE